MSGERQRGKSKLLRERDQAGTGCGWGGRGTELRRKISFSFLIFNDKIK